jgi:hypothetical protein
MTTTHERIVCALGKGAMTPSALLETVPNETITTIRAALHNLIQGGRIAFRFGSYELVPTSRVTAAGPALDDAPVVPHPSSEARKTDTERPPRPTFSRALTARLVELRRRRAQDLEELLERARTTRQELADLDELVRMATARDAG